MNRTRARKIAEIVTNEQLSEMLDNAKKGVKDWNVRSTVNKGMSKGAAWNILGAKFDIKTEHHVLGKANMIREFGDFLPEEIRHEFKPIKKELGEFVHQEPKL